MPRRRDRVSVPDDGDITIDPLWRQGLPMKSLGSVVLAALLLWPVAGQAQEVETGFLDRVVEFDGVTRKCTSRSTTPW